MKALFFMRMDGTPRAGFNPVWTQMVVTSSTCYDVIFLTE
jgi:hypothetical protein